MTRSTLRTLFDNNGRICHIKIIRNISLDKVAIAKPGKRIQRSQSMRNLVVQLPASSSPASSSVAPQLDLPKIKSILKKPSDKSRIIFGRRKSLGSCVTFNFSNGNKSQDNGKSSSSQQDDGKGQSNQQNDTPLIDFTDENCDSNNVARATVISIDKPLQPTILSQANYTKDQSTVTEIHRIFDEFDPLNSQTPSTSGADANNLHSTKWSSLLQSENLFSGFSAKSLSDNDTQMSKQVVRRPLPKLTPIRLVPRKTYKNSAKTPSPAERRSVPKLTRIHLFSREELSNAINSLPSTSNGNKNKGIVYRQIPDLLPTMSDVNNLLPEAEKTLDNNSSLSHTIDFESCDESFGSFHYDSNSD